MAHHFLDHLFTPAAIAVFGASENADAVGGRVFRNLVEDGFHGEVFAINPKYQKIGERACYPSLEAVRERVELAVIATPAATVPDLIRACGHHGVKAAIVLSAGFGERDEAGKVLQAALLEEARRSGIRILGPNCLGLMHPSIGLNATFSNNVAHAGSLALVSQSGALCTAILDWAGAHQIGFSAIVSVGDAADVGFGDILDYLAMDPETRSILMYVEGVRDARRFMSGLRAAARLKPVIVIKAGRHGEGARAALSHTGSLVGSDDVFDAALARAGVVRASTIEQLFAAAQLLSTPHRVKGNRLAIITNAGGPGVMASDRAVEQGIPLAELSSETMAELDRVLPAHWSHNNPVDILGDATLEHYRLATALCLADPNVDGALVMLTPQAMTDPTTAAQAVIAAAREANKPILTCWLGEVQVRAGRALFAQARIPTFVNPESALEAFGYLAEYHRSQSLLVQVPGPLETRDVPDVEGARLVIEGALAEKRSLLTALETRALFSAFHIPMLPALSARSPNEALSAAECLGFPVAMKIVSPDITHKSDVGGVRLNIASPQAVRHVYNDLIAGVRASKPDADIEGVSVEKMYRGRYGRELLLGVLNDPVFGPAISFGAGGTAVEIMRDRAVALPPLNEHIAHSLIEHTRIAKLLGPFRQMPPVNREALVQALLRLSEMVCELPQIVELDINPLMADEYGVFALDARVAVRDAEPGSRRYGHMAIHPYPMDLVTTVQLADGTDIVIRPIRPEDAEREQAFVRSLSEEAKYFRFMDAIHELSPDMLVRLTQLDYDRDLALVATVQQGDEEVELGVARYFTAPDGETTEFAVVVADSWQGRSIGSRLMSCLIQAARSKGYRVMQGDILANNGKMLRLMEKLGFTVHVKAEDPTLMVASRLL